jgi:uncharacterized protein (TIGR02421 family)
VLPDAGGLYIERPQPFFCLYRHPLGQADQGTNQLLSTQASYLNVPGGEADPTVVSGLIEAVLETFSRMFGGAILVEIWSAAAIDPDPQTGLQPARFRLFAPGSGVPLSTLEELDRALLASELPGSPVETEIVYGKKIGPPGMAAAISEKKARQIGATVLGIEVPPIYRTSDGEELLPLVLADIRRVLGRSMKRAFYVFAHAQAHYRPAHYHELGPHLLNDVARQVDADLAKVDGAVDLLLNVTPVNASQAWRRFRQAKFGAQPEFHYRALRLDPYQLKRELFAIPVEAVEDPALHHIFSMKREELDHQISMLSDRGSEKFLRESQQVYGQPSVALVDMANRILDEVQAHTHDDHSSDFVDAETFAELASAEFAFYREQDPSFASTIKIRDDIPGLMVSHGDFLIGADSVVARQRITATLQHEVGTHALTFHNGRNQPFKLLAMGLAGYEELQEGLAVLSEFLVGGLSRPRLRQLAVRVLAVAQLVQGAEFVDVYRSLHDQYGFNQRVAYNTTMRVFRGGGFTKDAVYLRGLVGVLEHLEAGGDMEILLSGKIALDHVEILEELRWRGILQPPRLIPRYLGEDQELVRTRLQDIVQSRQPAIDLVLESLL